MPGFSPQPNTLIKEHCGGRGQEQQLCIVTNSSDFLIISSTGNPAHLPPDGVFVCLCFWELFLSSCLVTPRNMGSVLKAIFSALELQNVQVALLQQHGATYNGNKWK